MFSFPNNIDDYDRFCVIKTIVFNSVDFSLSEEFFVKKYSGEICIIALPFVVLANQSYPEYICHF